MNQTFTVTLRFQFPAWNEMQGITYEVRAKTKSDAIRFAKVLAERDGHIGGHAVSRGRATFKAKEQT